MTHTTATIGDPSRSDTLTLSRALRLFASQYVLSRRVSDDLRLRLVAITRERSRIAEALEPHDVDAAASPELVEIDRVRTALDRSASAYEERLRALEAIIAALACERRPSVPTARPVAADAHIAEPPVFTGEAVVRGGWWSPDGRGRLRVPPRSDNIGRTGGSPR